MHQPETESYEYLEKKYKEQYDKLITEIGVEPGHPNFCKDIDSKGMVDVLAAKLQRVILQNEAIIAYLAGLSQNNPRRSQKLRQQAADLYREAHITELEGSCIALEKCLKRRKQNEV